MNFDSTKLYQLAGTGDKDGLDRLTGVELAGVTFGVMGRRLAEYY